MWCSSNLAPQSESVVTNENDDPIFGRGFVAIVAWSINCIKIRRSPAAAAKGMPLSARGIGPPRNDQHELLARKIE